MPSIYLSADAVLHVEVPWTAVPTDGDEYEVEVLDLVGAEMRSLGTWLQVGVKVGITGRNTTTPPVFSAAPHAL